MEDELLGRAQGRIGTWLGNKYRLERVLGVGGMAVVYAAAHRNGSRVALKVLHPELSVDPDTRGRFLREGYIANKVDHPGVVRVLDDDTSEAGAVFLVMDLLQGESVDERREKSGGRLPVSDVCAIANQLLDVLVAAHAKGIVHRDIKPENLFVTTDGVVKVLDFGIARWRGSGHRTRTGVSMGTPAFMPPEQARGRKDEVDGRSDLWAVGATVFTLLTGEYVHGGAATTEEIFIATATRPARSLRDAIQVPALIASVVDRALAFTKEERWPDASAMQKALVEAYLAAFGAPLGAVRVLAPSASQAPAGGKEPALPAADVEAVVGDDERARAAVSAPRSSTGVGLTRDGGTEATGHRGRSATRALLAGALLLVLGGFAVGLGKVASPGRGPTTPSFASALLPAAASGSSLPALTRATPMNGPLPSAGSSSPTIDVESLPPAASSRRPRPPPRPVGSASPREAAPECHIESYVETAKGEPVIRYRQICR